MKKVLILYAVLVIAVILLAVTRGGGLLNFFGSKATATVNKTTYNVLLAKTDDEKIKGLSGKNSLGTKDGMLFVFSTPGIYPFWMKNMKFPIDIIYINKDQVTDVFKNAQPALADSKPIIYKPSENANYVLEVNAGEAEKQNIKKGSKVVLKGVK